MSLDPIQFARGRDLLVIQCREYEGSEFIDLRLHYHARGELKPTQKGATIRIAELREVAAWLTAAADELDAPDRKPKRERRPASTMGAGPELTPEEEKDLF